jgi:ribonuclease BN (tRNA processing enzyme)
MNELGGASPTVTSLGCWAHTFAGPTTSFLVSSDNCHLLLDVGASPIQRLRELGISPPIIDYVYISHMHSDHVGGFANFVFTRQLLGRKIEKVPSLHVLAVGTVLEDVKKLLTLQYPERKFDIEWVPLEPMTEVPIGEGATLEAVPNLHTVPCFGARVAIGNSIIGFTSDTAPTAEHRDVYAQCSLLIGECFDLAANAGASLHARGHSSAEDLADLVAATQCPVVIPFHFDEKYHDEENRRQLINHCNPMGARMVVDPVATPVYVTG